MTATPTIRKLDPAEQDCILKIAHWYLSEWDTPLDKTISRLARQPGEDVLFQLVVAQGNTVVATGGLFNEVNIFNVHEHLRRFKPWVSSLYTDEGYRNQGWGSRLLAAIERGAQELNLERIYLYTFTAEALYLRCGWKPIERVEYKGQDTVVMVKEL